MLTDQDLENLLSDLESDRVERKASIHYKDKICQAICAFANDLPDHGLPGVVFIGVNDDGSCASLSITDKLLKELGGIRSDGNILPPPVIFVAKRVICGCDVAVVEVQPAYNPPVRYKGQVWIRVGPRRSVATVDEERRLTEKRRAGDLPFDQQPVLHANLDDLDIELFQRNYLPFAVARDVLAENQRTVEQQLKSLRFLSREGVPNKAAILVFGIDPQAYIPGAYVQFLRLEGQELTDPVRDQKVVTGPLPQMLRQTDEILSANISVGSDRQGVTEIRLPNYPMLALKEIVRNALMHRNYETSNAPVQIYWFSDRIEISNPGGPFGRVNKQNFGQPGITDYRNPLLAEAMRVSGYVQRFGSGIPMARKELEKNGNPPLEFKIENERILAILRKCGTGYGGGTGSGSGDGTGYGGGNCL
jgi:ATP-dependent DNA helicase RecG